MDAKQYVMIENYRKKRFPNSIMNTPHITAPKRLNYIISKIKANDIVFFYLLFIYHFCF